ncbi:MAG: hypothetical protein WA058_02870 [Minisyncoccia bacterium]
MSRLILALLVTLLIPTSTFAARAPASFSVGRSLVAASSSPGNAYLAGVSVVSTAPVAGDLSAAGGSVLTTAPVRGDELLLAGSVSSRASVTGDVRAAGGSVNVEGSIAGDLIAFGYTVYDASRPLGDTFIVAVNTAFRNGAGGPVTIYGNSISLAGDFASNVNIVATGHVTVAADTVIHGKLSYEAPEAATISPSANVIGGIEYTNASYLPDAGTSRTLALVSIGFFLFARILGALILASLFAGLFPKLAEAVVERTFTARPRSILLTMLLGFGILVATPVLMVLLALTFVGIGLAVLLFILYALLALLALLYAGILIGSFFARRFMRREAVLWHDGMFGMLTLSLIALVPYIGIFIALLIATFTAGVLLQIFFHFAFPHEDYTAELL